MNFQRNEFAMISVEISNRNIFTHLVCYYPKKSLDNILFCSDLSRHLKNWRGDQKDITFASWFTCLIQNPPFQVDTL